jgi:glutaredoxin 3
MGITASNSAMSANASPSNFRQFVEQEISQHQVVVFSKAYCPYCTSAKRLLQSSVKPPLEDLVIYELDKMPNGNGIQQELYRLTGQSTVPNIFVNRQHVGGNDDVQRIYRSGELNKLLLQVPS